MRTRAFRRHQRARAHDRRKHILNGHGTYKPERLEDHRIMHWHLRCNCFEHNPTRERRRQETRQWRTETLRHL